MGWEATEREEIEYVADADVSDLVLLGSETPLSLKVTEPVGTPLLPLAVTVKVIV